MKKKNKKLRTSHGRPRLCRRLSILVQTLGIIIVINKCCGAQIKDYDDDSSEILWNSTNKTRYLSNFIDLTTMGVRFANFRRSPLSLEEKVRWAFLWRNIVQGFGCSFKMLQFLLKNIYFW